MGVLHPHLPTAAFSLLLSAFRASASPLPHGRNRHRQWKSQAQWKHNTLLRSLPAVPRPHLLRPGPATLLLRWRPPHAPATASAATLALAGADAGAGAGAAAATEGGSEGESYPGEASLRALVVGYKVQVVAIRSN